MLTLRIHRSSWIKESSKPFLGRRRVNLEEKDGDEEYMNQLQGDQV